jgi:GNAT superfamily N-acetyltransferase
MLRPKRAFTKTMSRTSDCAVISTVGGVTGLVRPLGGGDLERVIAIDRAHTDRERRHFFEKRFEAAAAHPEDFVLIGAGSGQFLAGFVFAHLLHGEFGREHAAAALDAVGVAPEAQDRGIGQVLIEALVEVLHNKGVRSLQSEADWANHGLLRFFAASGFELGPRLILERPAAELLAEAIDEV